MGYVTVVDRHTFGVLFPILQEVMSRTSVDALSELCSPFVKGDNPTFIVVITSDLFPKNKYRSFEELRPEWSK